VDLKIKIATVLRRIDLLRAEWHLQDLLSAVGTDTMSEAQAERLASLLTDSGRIDDSMRVRERYSLPSASRGGRRDAWPSSSEIRTGPLSGLLPEPRHLAMAAAEGDSLSGWEELLHISGLTESTMSTVLCAVSALLYAGCPDKALLWCDSLLSEAIRRNAPGWEIVFRCLRAKIALRKGDLSDAEDFARSALCRLPGEGDVLLVGAPLSVLVSAYTLMGRHHAAALLLERAVAEDLFDTFYGLGYLHARGQHYLATGKPHAALNDFLTVGRLAKDWGIDRPAMLPWRGDAADALLSLGDAARADRLIGEQLALCGKVDSRIRGMSLRLRAAVTPELSYRRNLLEQAVDELQRAGDRVELARGLYDLGMADQTLGDQARGRLILRKAWRLAKESGAGVLCEKIRPNFPGNRREVPIEKLIDAHEKLDLSASEHRVAVLAASGLSNREIATDLFLTMSTVEQHLTRVYRKLKTRPSRPGAGSRERQAAS
jgi:tetratricopeptide (TPR) repeat protein